jgi:hypothetical protein
MKILAANWFNQELESHHGKKVIFSLIVRLKVQVSPDICGVTFQSYLKSLNTKTTTVRYRLKICFSLVIRGFPPCSGLRIVETANNDGRL